MDILEAPIASWTVDPDLDRNEQEMVGKFRGYEQETLHWSDHDKKAIRDPGVISRVSKAFGRCSVPIHFYFWQSTEPDYDRTMELGVVDHERMLRIFGEATTARIEALQSDDAVTIVMTSNIAEERAVPFNSPWIIAHRMGHLLINGRQTPQSRFSLQWVFNDFVRELLVTGYGLQWPNEETEHGRIFANEYRSIYGKLLGGLLGTMKSARDGKLERAYEWRYEMFAQYLITGRVTLNPLPEHFDEGLDLSTDPQARNKAKMIWRKFPQRLKRVFDKTLESARGKILVM